MENKKIYDIVKEIAILSDKDDITKEINLIKYNALKENVLDIRKWDNREEPKKMLKGITLSEDEARKLKDALNEYFKD